MFSPDFRPGIRDFCPGSEIEDANSNWPHRFQRPLVLSTILLTARFNALASFASGVIIWDLRVIASLEKR
jgi:hypothetical protein